MAAYWLADRQEDRQAGRYWQEDKAKQNKQA